MRPHRLAFCALGPYADMVEIDFDPLVAEGLFLIHGPTGAGKTFLLDALCFALYGDVPGERRRDTIHSDHAPPDASPWVELEFTSQEARWRVRRSPEHERVKKRGEGTTNRPATATLERLDGDDWYAVAAKTREVNNEIIELLGLTAQQFQQVILLPQGRFEQVLRSKSEDREKLLRKLFDTAVFESAAQWLDCAAKYRRDVVSDRASELATLRRQAAERWRTVTGEPEDEHRPIYDSRDAPDTDGAWPADQAAFDDLVKVAKSHKQRAEAAAESADELLESAQSTKISTDQIAKRWGQRARLREHRSELEEARSTIDDERKVLHLADAAEVLRQVLEDAQDNREKVGELASLVTDQVVAVAERWNEALSLPDDLTTPTAEAVPTLGELNSMNTALAAHREGLKRLAADAKKAAGLEKSAAQQATELSALNKQVEAAKKKWIDAKQQRLSRHDELLSLRQRRLDGIAAELAGTLADAEPCPVCGSTEHPDPAQPADDAVDIKDIEAAEKNLEKAEGFEATASDVYRGLVETAGDLRLSAAVPAEQALTLRKGIAAAIGEIDPRSAIADVDAVTTAVEALSRTMRALDAAKTALGTTVATLTKQLVSSPFATPDEAQSALRNAEERDGLRRRVDQHETATRDVGRDLEADDLQDLPDERPDTAAAADAVAVADKAARASNAWKTRTSDAYEAINGWAGNHRRQNEAYASELSAAELWSTVAERCNGRTPPKVSLRRWVLSAFLEEICTFANRRLGSMTGGRYRLSVHRERERSGGKAGLGLRVHDTYTGSEREVSTLSGGETFQASLSLALGVADVVTSHAGGVHLDALFVDEGFGTLDSEALQLAMDELDRLREGGRTVGLISHVGGLRERIRLGIEVHPSDRGSALRVGTVAPA